MAEARSLRGLWRASYVWRDCGRVLVHEGQRQRGGAGATSAALHEVCLSRLSRS
jgi:hypothetical protein